MGVVEFSFGRSARYAVRNAAIDLAMVTRSVKAARSAFYNAVRKNELTAALNAYSECADRDKYMLSNLVSAARREAKE